jgi:homoserine kinase
MTFTIKVPASTANIGPGFDVLGAGLTLYLILKVTLSSQTTIKYHTNDKVPLNPSSNYIYKVAQYIANANNQNLPDFTLEVWNEIPLGRGLGSSGSAIVGGIFLSNELLNLNMTRNEVLDFACFIEGHPDNVSGSIFGHLTTSFLTKQIPPFDPAYYTKNVSVKTPMDYGNLTRHRLLKAQKDIKAVVCIPTFEVLTSDSRKVLPKSYSREDCVFNIGRASMLIEALQDEVIDPYLIYECMQDKIHQSYRSCLVPGLDSILKKGPDDIEGLLGICLSGAGPTVLAFANGNFDAIGKYLCDMFALEDGKDGKIEASYKILDFDYTGTVVAYE